jgi:hypothetical protein
MTTKSPIGFGQSFGLTSKIITEKTHDRRIITAA